MTLTSDIYLKIKLFQDKDEIYQIQKDLHYKIIDFVFYKLLNSKQHNDDLLISEILEYISGKLPYNILDLLRFRIAFIKYSKDLIILMREIVRRSDPIVHEPISPHFILKYFKKKRINLPFKYTFLHTTFLPYLKRRYPRRFNYLQEYI
jgi:hypothetical protein